MIIENFKKRFEILKSSGVNIQFALDIGAYRGDFTRTLHSVWPTAIVRQIEADERQRTWLNQGAIFAVLGDANRFVDFYTLPEDKITTGSSVFRENTSHYAGNAAVVLQKEMVTLDELDGLHNFYGKWQTHGLVKIDTQGSELLILDGARKFLESRKPRFMLLECSIQEYNQGAPKINTVVKYMDKLQYEIVDFFDLSYSGDGKLLQADILFERTVR